MAPLRRAITEAGETRVNAETVTRADRDRALSSAECARATARASAITALGAGGGYAGSPPEVAEPSAEGADYAVPAAPTGDYATPSTYTFSSYDYGYYGYGWYGNYGYSGDYGYGDWFGWYGPWNYAGIYAIVSLPPATELKLGSNFWDLSGELDRATEQDWETFDRFAYVGSSYGAVTEDARAAALPGGQAGSSSDTTFGARPTANTGVWAGTDTLASCSWTGEGSSTSGPIGPISTTSTTATTSECSDVSSGPERKSFWSRAQDAWNGVKAGCQAVKDFFGTDLHDWGTQKSHQYHGQGFNMGTGSGTLSQSIEIQNDRSQAAFSRATRGRTSQQTIDAGQNLAAAVNAPFDLVINHPDEYWKKVGEAATGIFWDAPKNEILGLINMRLHPIDTVYGIYVAVTHYRETYDGLKGKLTETLLYGNEREQGELAGHVLLLFLPTKAGVDKLKTFAQANAKYRPVLEAAEEARLVAVSREGKVVDLGPAKAHAGKLMDEADVTRALSEAKGHAVGLVTLASGIDRSSPYLRVLPCAETANRLERFAQMKGIQYTFDPNIPAPFTNAKTGLVTFRGVPGQTKLADIPIIDIIDEFAHAWGIKNPNLVGATAPWGYRYWKFHQEVFGRTSVLKSLTPAEAEALQWAETQMMKELKRLNDR